MQENNTFEFSDKNIENLDPSLGAPSLHLTSNKSVQNPFSIAIEQEDEMPALPKCISVNVGEPIIEAAEQSLSANNQSTAQESESTI
jgi:predicted O-linked N-acetylglucosamine transferase (SPINDLY family)